MSASVTLLMEVIAHGSDCVFTQDSRMTVCDALRGIRREVIACLHCHSTL